MPSLLASPTSSVRCFAFKAGPLSRACLVRPQVLRPVTLARLQPNASSAGAPSAGERHATSLGRVEAAAVALLASGVLAGSCFAADSPDSAAQTVQLAKLASDILKPTFNIFTLLYIIRITMTWYPEIDGKKFPWALAYVPTEPILSVTRKVVPLVSGVDVSPIVWVGLISFLNEILLGPQGILTLIQARGGL